MVWPVVGRGFVQSISRDRTVPDARSQVPLVTTDDQEVGLFFARQLGPVRIDAALANPLEQLLGRWAAGFGDRFGQQQRRAACRASSATGTAARTRCQSLRDRRWAAERRLRLA